MAAATPFEVQPTIVEPVTTEKSTSTAWNSVQKSISKVEGQVRDQLATFRKTIDSVRAKGTERYNELKTTFAPAHLKALLTNNKTLSGLTKNASKVFEDGKSVVEDGKKLLEDGKKVFEGSKKVFEDGKKFSEETAQKLGLAKLTDLQGLAKLADIDALKDAFAGVQTKLDHLRQKVDKMASKAAPSAVSNQSAE